MILTDSSLSADSQEIHKADCQVPQGEKEHKRIAADLRRKEKMLGEKDPEQTSNQDLNSQALRKQSPPGDAN